MALSTKMNDVCDEVERYGRNMGVNVRVFGLEYAGRFTKVCLHMSMPGREAYKHQYWTDVKPDYFKAQARQAISLYVKDNTTLN